MGFPGCMARLRRGLENLSRKSWVRSGAFGKTPGVLATILMRFFLLTKDLEVVGFPIP